jgi:hypothetical protein
VTLAPQVAPAYCHPMRRLLAATPLLALLVALAGCPRAPVGVENVELPADSAATCQAQCGKVGLRMQSLVIMANYVGCVCAPADDVERPSASAGAAGGGLAAIMVLQQQQQQPPSSSDSSRPRSSNSRPPSKPPSKAP